MITEIQCDFCGSLGKEFMYVLSYDDSPDVRNPRIGLRKNDICGACLEKVNNLLDDMMAEVKS